MGQQVFRVLLLGLDQGRREDADDLVKLGIRPRQTQILAVRPAHVQVEIDEDAALGQFVDEEVQPIESLWLDGLAILAFQMPCGQREVSMW